MPRISSTPPDAIARYVAPSVAARLLGVHIKTVHRALAAGTLKGKKLGKRRLLVDVKSIDDLPDAAQ